MTKDVIISAVGAGGDGIAKGSSGNIYVPFTLPGEKANVATEGDKGTLIALTSKSNERIEPTCVYFEDCGGCSLQHWNRENYEAWKRDLVVHALEARGLKTEVAPLISCEPQTRRRIVLTAKATPKGLVLGFNRYQSNEIVEIHECPVTVEAITSRFDDIHAIAAVLQDNARSFHVTVTAANNGLDIMISGVENIEDRHRQRLTTLAIKLNIARIAIDDEIIIEVAKPLIDFDGVEVILPPGGFLQATTEAEIAMTGIAVNWLKKTKNAVDLFSGSGTFTFPMAKKMNVKAVENTAAALQALDRASRYATGLKTVVHEERDLFRRPLNAKELAQFDGLVFDPPRAGAEEQAKEIANAIISRVVAVSCNPVTLARDLSILVKGGYKLEKVIPVDQFLWSPHVEAVALLSKRNPKPGWKL
ncbi:class I SAM-dependent RNA methyltransferase [Bartonella sp. HY761]|uniref:class I SAM-dependent RNA methyltransferase n=1 Tax=Bartonella sp. HY761 TaxID=2979330 RepID=UPI00220F18EF|nr:class I SAM-dependent RNA methyltransferase [Bartonella sp. HY761]UXN05304.1 class I SAM-dependent RNA methyltransferase [Bartonella sp. HY761]